MKAYSWKPGYALGEELTTDRIRLCVDDGRTMFDVSIGKDGRSIEICAVDTVRVKNVLYSNRIIVEPRASNFVVVRTVPYDD